MKIFFILLLLSLFMASLYIYGAKSVNNQYIRPPYIAIAGEISSEVASMLKNRYKMRVMGVTEGMADNVNYLGLSFQIRGPLSKERLREIIVDCVEEYLNAVNTNEQIRPFLKNYPFTVDELEIVIFIQDKDGVKVFAPEIMVAAKYGHKINYRTIDENQMDYKTTETEEYETALKIVRSKNL